MFIILDALDPIYIEGQLQSIVILKKIGWINIILV